MKITNSQFNSNDAKLGPDGTFNGTRGCVLSEGLSTIIENCEFSNIEPVIVKLKLKEKQELETKQILYDNKSKKLNELRDKYFENQ